MSDRKAVISNRIFLSGLSQEEMERIAIELYYKIVTQLGAKLNTEIVNNFTRIGPGSCSIPSGRIDLIPDDFTIIDNRHNNIIEDFPEFTYKLRESQQEIYDQVEESCIVNAHPSWGKTFTGIAIASKLSRKTLIVTHTTLLRNQWAEEIEKTLGFIPDTIGSGKYAYKTPIVVSNSQTLIKHVDKIADKFGLVILDEMHHVPSKTFSHIMDKLKARYKIGLSGTLIRKDKKHIIFRDYFGDIVYKPEKENSMTPRVLLVETNYVLKPDKHWALRVNELELYDIEYRKFIVDFTNRLIDKGYKPLVVGTRVDFLNWCASKANDSVAITGEVKSIEERKRLLSGLETGEVSAIFGTLSIFSEGISQNDLNCLVLATPINNDSLLTQLIGRIIREKEGKKQPLIVDIKLKGPSTDKQAKSRLALYIRNGYNIQVLKT